MDSNEIKALIEAYRVAREAYHSYDGGDAARLQHLGLALELAAQNLNAALYERDDALIEAYRVALLPK